MQRDKVPGTNYIIVQDENNFKYTSDSLFSLPLSRWDKEH